MSAPAPPRPSRIRTLMGWGVAGQLVYVASQFVTLVALTRFAPVEDVGAFGLASSVVIPVFFFFGLNMRVNVAAGRELAYGFSDFRALLALSASLGWALVAVIGAAGFAGTALALLLILGGAKTAESVSDLCYGMMQRHDRMDLVAASLVLRSVLGTTAVVTVLASGAATPWAFLAQAAVWASVAAVFDHRHAAGLARRSGDTRAANAARLADLARRSLPLALTGLLSALQGNAPRYAIAGLLGVVALGHFTVVAYAMQAIATVVGAATDSLIARLNAFLAAGQKQALRRTLVKLLGGLAVCGAFGVVLSLLLGDWLLAAVFGAEYAGLGALLAICVLAAALQSFVLVLQACLLAGRAFARNLAIRVGSGAAMLGFCLAGAAAFGLIGVGWGMCAAFVLHAVALALAVRGLIARAGPDPAENPHA